MPTSYMERSMSQFGDIAAQIAKGVRTSQEKKKRNRIAQELAAQYGLHGVDDMDELKLALEMERANADKRHKEALIQRALREPQGNAAASRYIETPEGTMTAAEWARIRDARAKQENQLAPGSPGPAGMIWTGQSFQEAPEEYTKQQTKAQQLQAEIARLEAAADAGNEYWGPERLGIGTPSSAQAKARRAELEAVQKALQPSTAADIYKSKTGVDPNASALAAPVKPQMPTTGSHEVRRRTKDGRIAIFDAVTKQFLRYAD